MVSLAMQSLRWSCSCGAFSFLSPSWFCSPVWSLCRGGDWDGSGQRVCILIGPLPAAAVDGGADIGLGGRKPNVYIYIIFMLSG